MAVNVLKLLGHILIGVYLSISLSQIPRCLDHVKGQRFMIVFLVKSYLIQCFVTVYTICQYGILTKLAQHLLHYSTYDKILEVKAHGHTYSVA